MEPGTRVRILLQLEPSWPAAGTLGTVVPNPDSNGCVEVQADGDDEGESWPYLKMEIETLPVSFTEVE